MAKYATRVKHPKKALAEKYQKAREVLDKLLSKEKLVTTIEGRNRLLVGNIPEDFERKLLIEFEEDTPSQREKVKELMRKLDKWAPRNDWRELLFKSKQIEKSRDLEEVI